MMLASYASRSSGLGIQRRQSGAIVLCVIAIIALMQRRMNYDHTIAVACEFFLGSVAIATVYYFNKTRRYDQRLIDGLAILAAAFFPWIFERILRSQGLGIATEILMLGSLAWVSVTAAVISYHARTIGLAVVTSGFLVLFTTCIADSSISLLFAFLWASVCLWWLASNQWERLQSSAAIDVEITHGLRWIPILLGCGLFMLAASLITGRFAVVGKLQSQWMPTSGGNNGHDNFARSGVGDGEVVIAARSNPQTFAAIDTNFFIESPEPSLYDVISEQFGEPRKKSKWEPSQALDRREMNEDESKIAEANRSSQSFSIDRDPPQRSGTLDDLKSDAIMFWKGRAGVSLAVERFDAFDGHQWTKSNESTSLLEPRTLKLDHMTWFQKQQESTSHIPEPVNGAISEALKFTKFRSPIIPTHGSIAAWRIDQVDRADFFAHTPDDCLTMTNREHVPDYTTVHFVNCEYDLDSIEGFLRIPHQTSHSVACEASVTALAEQYADDPRRGWSQIIGVINGLRRDFKLDRNMPSQEMLGSTIEQFFMTHRGSDYLFATTAAMMLQHLGYETRFVTGFYTEPKHLDWTTGEIGILPKNIHAWLEVCVGEDTWIPLEPSPGYLQPHYNVSLSTRIRQAAPMLGLCSMIGLTICCLMWLVRRQIFECCCRVLYFVTRSFDDRVRIAWLLYILDRRCRLISIPRPSNITPRNFYTLHLTVPTVQNFFDEADRIFYGMTKQLTPLGQATLKQLWHHSTISKFQKLKRQSIA